MLGRELERDTFIRLDAKDHPVGMHPLHIGAAKQRIRRLMKADRDFGRSTCHIFTGAQVERHASPAPVVDDDQHGAELTRFGLASPPIIVLLYARDSSTPLARLELGTAADSFDRYARLAPKGDVVTIAKFEVNRLTELLKAVGAGS